VRHFVPLPRLLRRRLWPERARLYPERMISLLLKAGKSKIVITAGMLLAITAFLDWAVGNTVSLSPVYIVPVMLAAFVLRPPGTIVLAVLCSCLRTLFDTPASPTEEFLRFVFAITAYSLSGLFVNALVRNHYQAVQHFEKIQVEQELRREAEKQLELLVESSPAAILTIDAKGIVLAANSAANRLLLPAGHKLQGRSIVEYLPVFAHALQVDVGPEGMRTAAKCQGRRNDGEIFLAHTWFSSYQAPEGRRLSAIVVDSSEEMREREEQGLEYLLRGNRIFAAGMAHEVRNFCGAMKLLCAHLVDNRPEAAGDDMRGLGKMIETLEAIATSQLQSKTPEILEDVPLAAVLADLRIIADSSWREIDGAIRWNIPASLPLVVAEPHGLLQAFLNLAENSRRAVEAQERSELDISVREEGRKVFVRFHDNGPGIPSPERLFQPFQPGAAGAGLGLYVSRSIVRSYGGDLRFEPGESGTCFVVELQTVPAS
jgi:two-component system sensor kinase FixL